MDTAPPARRIATMNTTAAIPLTEHAPTAPRRLPLSLSPLLLVLSLITLAWLTHGWLWGAKSTTPADAHRHVGRTVEMRDLTVFRRVDGRKGILYLNIDARFPNQTAAIAIKEDECPQAYYAAMNMTMDYSGNGSYHVAKVRGFLTTARGRPVIWIRAAHQLETTESPGYAEDRAEPGGTLR